MNTARRRRAREDAAWNEEQALETARRLDEGESRRIAVGLQPAGAWPWGTGGKYPGSDESHEIIRRAEQIGTMRSALRARRSAWGLAVVQMRALRDRLIAERGVL